MKAHERWARILIGGFLLAWFLVHSWPGLFVYFQDDDMMNLHGAWMLRLDRLVIANLTPWTDVYRPLGSALYRGLFTAAGLDPLPYRVVMYLLMAANIGLVYWLARRLKLPAEVAVLGALIFSFHHRMLDLYLNNGTIYDVLCATMTLLTLIYYTYLRAPDRQIRWWEYGVLFVLLAAALNSKEMAFVIPGLLLIYELIFRGITVRGLSMVAVSGVITLAAVNAKLASTGPFQGNPSYAVELTAERYMATTRKLLSDLFYLTPDSLSTTAAILILVAVFAAAYALRRKDLQFSAWFLLLTPLPINFIATRGFFVMYLPYAGWAIFFAILIGKLFQALIGQPWVRGAAMLAICGALLAFAHRYDRWGTFHDGEEQRTAIRNLQQDLARLSLPVPPGGSVLFANDPFEPENWMPVFLVKLQYGDRDLRVERSKTMNPAPEPKDYAKYDHVINYAGGRVTVFK